MKWYGKIGFANSVETSPGVWDDVITEKDYIGDVTRDTRRFSNGTGINDNIAISNTISILADPYTTDNYYAMRYVEYLGTKWKITSIEVSYPRLIIYLGGVWNENED